MRNFRSLKRSIGAMSVPAAFLAALGCSASDPQPNTTAVQALSGSCGSRDGGTHRDAGSLADSATGNDGSTSAPPPEDAGSTLDAFVAADAAPPPDDATPVSSAGLSLR